jgi:hypothetical protein
MASLVELLQQPQQGPDLRDIGMSILRAKREGTSVGQQLDTLQSQRREQQAFDINNQMTLMDMQWRQTKALQEQGNADAAAVADAFEFWGKNVDIQDRGKLWEWAGKHPEPLGAQNAFAIFGQGVTELGLTEETKPTKPTAAMQEFALAQENPEFSAWLDRNQKKVEGTKPPGDYQLFLRFKQDNPNYAGTFLDFQGDLAKVKDTGKGGPTDAQLANNQEILKAREIIDQIPPEELRLIVQPEIAGSYGRSEPNPNYDPYVAGLIDKAGERLTGADDPGFDQFWSSRYQTQPTQTQAQPLPANLTPENLTVGATYQGYDGALYKWDGTAFQPVR